MISRCQSKVGLSYPLDSVVKGGIRITSVHFPNIKIVVFFERKVPISMLVHLFKELWSNTGDDIPVIFRSSPLLDPEVGT
jgi:nuclear transport factor 2 (NTF2) superfamily protein